MTALIVADDFTGACDAAVAFSAYLPSVRVLAPGSQSISSGADVWAVSTESRHTAPAAVEEQVLRAAGLVRKHLPPFVLKKIDSVFRGNTFAEVAAWARVFPDRLVLLAPAYPGLGRRMCRGSLLVNDLAGTQAIDVHAGLNAQTLPCKCVNLPPGEAGNSLTERMQRAWTSGERLLLCDSANDEELHRVVDAGLRTGLKILWIGSGGLSHVLAQAVAHVQAPALPGQPEAATAAPKPAGPILYCIGSPHAVTARQITCLKRMVACVELFSSTASSADIEAPLRQGKHVLLCIGRDGLNPSILAARLCSLAGALVVSGGETAAMVCRALDVESIALRGELLPGIPWGIVHGGPAHELVIATKSGGFGPEHALAEIAARFGSAFPDPVPASIPGSVRRIEEG